MKTRASLKKRQGGAVAIMVGFSIVLLVGFLAMVIDLGHLYLAKTELQNGADAAALAGAKELNGTRLGVISAISLAQQYAGKNDYDFDKPIFDTTDTPTDNDNIDIWVGTCPDDSCMVPATPAISDATAAGRTFLKVHTGNRDLLAWFAPIWNIFHVSTFGVAVAGRFLTPITPIGVCALRTDREAWVQYEVGGDRYQVELGYMRGVSYDLKKINTTLSGLVGGDALYLHPTATSDTGCITNQGNADFAAPFLCTGSSAISGGTGSTVYSNTGLAAGKSIAALNTRFDQYGPPLDSALDRTICPPDANIRQYVPGPGNGGANNWMSPTPQQVSAFGLENWLPGPPGTNVVRNPLTTPPLGVVNANINGGGCGGNCDDNYGVLWTYTRPIRSSGSFAPTDWPNLYPTGPTINLTYAGLSPSYVEPYRYGLANQSNPLYFLAPTPAVSQSPNPRRVLNVVIIECPAPGGGICRPLTVLGVGRFFMQRTADMSAWIAGEFAGLIPESELNQEIRLFR